jgi:hypothetical protein
VRLATEHFTLPLPDGFVDTSEGDVASASSRAEAQEVVVSVARLGAGAPVEWVLAELARARQEALRSDVGAKAFAPVTVEARPGRVTKAFVAGGMPLVFCALVAGDATAAARVVVTLSLYQYTQPTAPVVADFMERAGAMLGALTLHG